MESNNEALCQSLQQQIALLRSALDNVYQQLDGLSETVEALVTQSKSQSQPQIQPQPQPQAQPQPQPQPIPQPKAQPERAGSCDGRLLQSLSRSLGINDRYRLRHDLFNGNDALMWDTLSALDAMANFEEADAYLKAQFSWDAQQDTAAYFYDMLRRRFHN